MSQSQDALVEQIDRTWNLIRGRMLGFFESLGLPAGQEAGAKSTFKALASDAQDRLVGLVADDALAGALAAVGEGIAELERCRERAIADHDLEFGGEARPVITFLDARLAELRDHKSDLEHLERVQRSLGGAR